MFPNFMQNVRHTFDNLAHGGVAAAAATAAAGAATATAAAGGTAPPTEPRRTPPASAKAVRMLPFIKVAPEDLIDANNRECCVCLEANELDDRVVRLPCAHIFHARCIVDWLGNHSCTCPVCRYELPTDDPQYEVGRIERMKTRKPRYARHELKRLPVSDLLALKNRRGSGGSRPSATTRIMEKSELIQWLIDNERIDVIPAPEPVRYKLEVLGQMRIKDLKRTMEEAGVYYRKEDVVEKSDMLTIFLNSGRLELIAPPEPPEPCAVEAANKDVKETKEQADQNIPAMTASKRSASTTSTGSIKIETVTEGDSDNEEEAENAMDETPNFMPQVMFPHLDNQDSKEADATNKGDSLENHGSREQDEATNGNGVDSHATENAGTSVAAPSASTVLNPEATPGSSYDNPIDMDLDDEEDDPPTTFHQYSIQQLQDLAKDASIDLSGASERNEIVARLQNVGLVGNDDPSAITSIKFSSWSISQLRGVASVANIDLSNCSGREEIVHKVLYEVNFQRPRLKELIRSIPPFHSYSTADLRRIAGDMQVDISDCLEKDEIMYRLITRGRQHTS